MVVLTQDEAQEELEYIQRFDLSDINRSGTATHDIGPRESKGSPGFILFPKKHIAESIEQVDIIAQPQGIVIFAREPIGSLSSLVQAGIPISGTRTAVLPLGAEQQWKDIVATRATRLPSGLEPSWQDIWKYDAGKDIGGVITVYSGGLSSEAIGLIEIATTFSKLGVGYHVDKGVLPLLDEFTLSSVRIVTDILANEISRGLPVEQIEVKPLTDRDAGEWSEVVFNIQVRLDSAEANREWDNILTKVSEAADRQVDKEISASLLEKVGIHFKWVTSGDV